MSWYKVTLRGGGTEITLRSGAIQERFAARMAGAALLQQSVDDMALLLAGDTLRGEVDVYFTPACHPHMAALIAEAGAVESEPPPSPDDLAHLAGGHGWRERYFPETEKS